MIYSPDELDKRMEVIRDLFNTMQSQHNAWMWKDVDAMAEGVSHRAFMFRQNYDADLDQLEDAIRNIIAAQNKARREAKAKETV